MRLMRRTVLLLVVLAGCGRIGFGLFGDEHVGDGGVVGDGGGDAIAVDALGTGADAGLCAAAIQLPIDTGGTPVGSWVGGMTAVPTATGIAVFYVAPDGNIFAATYHPIGGVMSAGVSDTQVAASATSAGTLSVPPGNTLLFASTTAGGSTLFEVTNGLEAVANNAHVGQFAVARPLASSGDRTTMAFLYNVDGQNVAEAISGALVTAAGVESGLQTVIPASQMPLSVSIDSAGVGYVVTWVNTATSPTTVQLALTADSLVQLTAGRAGVGNTTDVFQPRTVWAPTSQRYLTVWSQDNGGTGADVWMQVSDSTLTALAPAKKIGTGGRKPRLATDGTDFWVAWNDDSPTNLSSAYVTSAGAATTRAIFGSGGTVIDFDVVAVSGVVHVVWAERNGTLPALWDIPASVCDL